MTEDKPTYVRVNVSTATSIPEYDEEGDRKAEIDMMLPANLVSQVDGVKKAEMGVMKMSLPLGNLKGPTLQITRADITDTHGLHVYVDGFVGITKWHFLQGNAMSNTVADGDYCKASSINNAGQYRFTIPSSLSKSYPYVTNPDLIALARKMNETKEYQTRSLLEYLFILSEDLTSAMTSMFLSNYVSESAARSYCPLFRFSVNSDNTISLFVYIRSAIFDYSFANSSASRSSPSYSMSKETYAENMTSIGVRSASWKACHELGLFVSKQYADALPTLPWTAVQNKGRQIILPSTFPGDDAILYFLRTDQAAIFVHEGSYQFYPSEETPLFTCTKTIEYKFPFADATSLANLQCLALTMNGTTFNQQVYPVNMTATQMADAQTMSLPVIDVYYPLWKTPSDLNTNMIIVKENFTDSGPVTIDPSLLKERHIKFKIYCIMNDGKMKEFTIPKNASFSFQLCFALYR